MNRISLFLSLALSIAASASNSWACDQCEKWSQGIMVGERVYAVTGARADTAATVVSIQSDGSFVLRFESDSAVGANWDRASLAKTTGCSENICVGNSVYTTSGARSGTGARVVGVELNGDLVLMFDSDSAVGHEWSPSDLARREGCVEGSGWADRVCVSDHVYAVSGPRADTAATIAGIQSNGNFVLQFDSDSATGANWDRSSIALTRGCSNGICVNQPVYALTGARSGATAKVVALQSNGNYVLMFDSDSAVGHDWDRNSISCVQQ